LGAENSSSEERVIHGADAPWLDSCDEHRSEGEVERWRGGEVERWRGGEVAVGRKGNPGKGHA
jgi:hypothetical protein